MRDETGFAIVTCWFRLTNVRLKRKPVSNLISHIYLRRLFVYSIRREFWQPFHMIPLKGLPVV